MYNKAVPGTRVPGYPTKTVITQFHFSVQLPVNDFLKFGHLSGANRNLWFLNNVIFTLLQGILFV